MTKNQKTRGKKQDPYSQTKLILEVLKNGGHYLDEELGKLVTGELNRAARSSIAILRKQGHPIAAENRISSETGRLRNYYYYESNKKRFYDWAVANGYFTFSKGAPKSRKTKRTNNQLQLL